MYRFMSRHTQRYQCVIIPEVDIQLFRQRLSHKSVTAYATMPNGLMGTKSLALID